MCFLNKKQCVKFGHDSNDRLPLQVDCARKKIVLFYEKTCDFSTKGDDVVHSVLLLSSFYLNTQNWLSKFSHNYRYNATTKSTMSAKRSSTSTLSSIQNRSYRGTSKARQAAIQTSDIQQMNHDGKRKANGNGNEPPFRARKKSVLSPAYRWCVSDLSHWT